MDESLHIDALGALRITVNGNTVERFTAQKAGALLVYLAYTGQPHAREHLAELLWHEHSPEQAYGSLRMALAVLRRHLPAHLETSRLAIGLAPGTYRLDAAKLISTVDDFRKSRGHITSSLVRRMNDALDLYRGDLLRDFFGGSPEFETWLYTARDQARAAFCDGTLSLAEHFAQMGSYDEALDNLRRALVFDPLNESLNNQIMLMLSHQGRTREALEQYQAYHSRLAADLDVEPSAKSVTLYHLVRGQMTASSGNEHHSAHPHNGHMHRTSMVGREILLMEIASWLEDGDENLLTLVGPGGIGKTRLALAAADLYAHSPLFPDGMYFIPLASYNAAAQIVPAVAAALEYTPIADGRSLHQQIIDFVETKHLLMVLDNYEHVLDGADFAAQMAASPHVRVLVTSREPLQAAGERLLYLQGLAYPAQGSPPPDYDAACLFVRAVQRLYPDYAPAMADAAPIAQLCRLVDGSPLGLLLAAPWMDVLTPQEIAAQIATSIEILENQVPGLPERQRSIRAVFATTWERLPARLRATFMQMAVFQGGCTVPAAQAVTGAGLRDLQELVSKMLVTRDASGRLSIHELLRQYAEEHLRESDSYAATRSAHSACYLTFLAEREADIKGLRQQQALKEIERDFENVRVAWMWAAERGDFDLLDSALEGLYWYYGLQYSGIQFYGGLKGSSDYQHARYNLLQAALEQAQRANADKLYGRLLARCWLTPAEGRTRLRQALAIALRHENAEDIAHCLYQRGRVALYSSWDAACAILERAYQDYNALNDTFYISLITLDWSSALIYAGRLQHAEQVTASNLDRIRRSGNEVSLAAALYNHGATLFIRGADVDANHYYEKARELLLKLDKRLIAADVGGWGMSIVALRTGNFTLLRQRASELLALSQEYHSTLHQARALAVLSILALVDDDPHESLALAEESIRLFGSHANRPYADAFLAAAAALGDVTLAREICQRWLAPALSWNEKILTSLLLIPASAVLKSEGRAEQAIQCASLALHHTSNMGRWTEAVLALYGLPGDLARALSPHRYADAWERGKTLDPQTVVGWLSAAVQA